MNKSMLGIMKSTKKIEKEIITDLNKKGDNVTKVILFTDNIVTVSPKEVRK